MDSGTYEADILIVDDELTMTRSLARVFELMGYGTCIASTGEDALDFMERQRFDLVLLDLRMPGMDGLEVLTAAQALAPGTTFVILTAHGSLGSAISALRQGAFDYLLKPCSIDEIVETVQRGLKKSQRRRHQEKLVDLLKQTLAEVQSPSRDVPDVGSRLLAMGPLTLDTQRRAVIVDGELMHLSKTEYDLMNYLAHHLNQAVTCSELVRHTHGLDLSERKARPIIRMHVHRLRQKIEPDPSYPKLLRTVRGVGYIFVSDNADEA